MLDAVAKIICPCEGVTRESPYGRVTRQSISGARKNKRVRRTKREACFFFSFLTLSLKLSVLGNELPDRALVDKLLGKVEARSEKKSGCNTQSARQLFVFFLVGLGIYTWREQGTFSPVFGTSR